MGSQQKGATCPSWAYHGTLERLLITVMDDGLLPQPHETYDEPVLWFTDDALGATYYGPIVLRFPIPRDRILDDDVRGYCQFVSYRAVRPEEIEVWNYQEASWIPLDRVKPAWVPDLLPQT